MHDLRFAFRQLFKHPGFTAVATLTLALGLAANATILGIINAFFFEPLQVAGADRLVFVLQKTDVVEFPRGYSWLDYQDLLYGLNPLNLPVFAVVVLLLAGIALLASYLPARRAAQLNPMQALRQE